jgi:geranylgeranyl pyrophosphate synthase
LSISISLWKECRAGFPSYSVTFHFIIFEQITDDVLDYQMTQSALGKPASVDLKLGLATAPILYAAQEDPTLYKLIRRNFQKPGDVEKAIRGVVTSSALTKSMDLAQEYTSKAVAHLNQFSNCKEKEQLNFLTREIIDRKK